MIRPAPSAVAEVVAVVATVRGVVSTAEVPANKQPTNHFLPNKKAAVFEQQLFYSSSQFYEPLPNIKADSTLLLPIILAMVTHNHNKNNDKTGTTTKLNR